MTALYEAGEAFLPLSCDIMQNMNARTKGALLASLGGICWGISGSIGQYLFTYEGMDSRWLVPVRLGLAGIVLLGWCMKRDGQKTFDPWRQAVTLRQLFVYGLLGISCCQFLYFLAIQLSNAAAATILQNMSCIFILITVCIQAKRKPLPREILAVFLALGGLFLLTTHGDPQNLAVSPAAIIAGTASGFCVMIYNCFSKDLMKRYPLLLLQGWSFLIGGVFFCLVFRFWQMRYIPTVTGWLGILFVALIGNVFSFTCYMKGVSLIGPDKAILYGFAEPVSAALISIFFLHTAFTLYDLAGFILVFMMLVLISVKKEKDG